MATIIAFPRATTPRRTHTDYSFLHTLSASALAGLSPLQAPDPRALAKQLRAIADDIDRYATEVNHDCA